MQINTIDNLLLLNTLSATGTLFLEIFTGIFFLFLIYFKLVNNKTLQETFITKFIRNTLGNISNVPRFTLVIIFLFSLSASALTLVYSEIFGVIPCALCWFERIFMYGVVLISVTALWSGRELEQRGILKYVLNFSILGWVISLYHHVLQMSAQSGLMNLPCPASGGDCAKRIIFEYGHITFPWMAFVLFSFFILIIVFVRILNNKD